MHFILDSIKIDTNEVIECDLLTFCIEFNVVSTPSRMTMLSSDIAKIILQSYSNLT